MSSGVRRVGHTGITVSDLDRSVAFYRDVLGFPATAKTHLGGELAANVTGVPGAEIDIVFVSAPGHTIELLQYRQPTDGRPSTLRANDPGCFHLCFLVDDIDQMIDTVRAAGFEPVAPVQTVTDGPRQGLRAVYTRDPDGVLLELMQEPGGEHNGRDSDG